MDDISKIMALFNPNREKELKVIQYILARELCKALMHLNNYSFSEAVDDTDKVVDLFREDLNEQLAAIAQTSCRAVLGLMASDPKLKPFGFQNYEAYVDRPQVVAAAMLLLATYLYEYSACMLCAYEQEENSGEGVDHGC